MRIISLVPSQTELLHYLGLYEQVVGITRFCIRPKEWHASKPRVGGAKDVNLDKVRSLRPDLIIANREENVKEQIEALAADFQVHVTDVNDLPSALSMITEIGTLTGALAAASALEDEMTSAFDAMDPFPPLTAAYAIWNDPLMLAGNDTFIHDMMQRAGLTNVVSSPRYPVTSIDAVRELSPQLLLLSSEPFPFRQKHLSQFHAALPETEVMLVDGEMFSWYGPRMLQFPGYINNLRRISLDC